MHVPWCKSTRNTYRLHGRDAKEPFRKQDCVIASSRVFLQKTTIRSRKTKLLVGPLLSFPYICLFLFERYKFLVFSTDSMKKAKMALQRRILLEQTSCK